MNPLSYEPIFSKLAFYLNAIGLYKLVVTCKDIHRIGMLPNYKAKLYDYKSYRSSKYGDLPVIIWLHNNNYTFTIDAMGLAASNGHLEVVKWLHENRMEGCTKYAMDWAAWYGHLEVVKWLHENRKEGCTKWAMDRAAEYAHLEVVQYLEEH
jgi:hypothetical protein